MNITVELLDLRDFTREGQRESSCRCERVWLRDVEQRIHRMLGIARNSGREPVIRAIQERVRRQLAAGEITIEKIG